MDPDLMFGHEYLFVGLMSAPARPLPAELKDKICKEISLHGAMALSTVNRTWKAHADRRIFRTVVIHSQCGLDTWKKLEATKRVVGLPRVVIVQERVSAEVLQRLLEIKNIRQNVQQLMVTELTSSVLGVLLTVLPNLRKVSRVRLGFTWGLWPGSYVLLQRLSNVRKLEGVAVIGSMRRINGTIIPIDLAKLALPSGGRALSEAGLQQILRTGWIQMSSLRFFSVTVRQEWGDESLGRLLEGMGGLEELEIDSIGCKLARITFRSMPNLTTFSCRANMNEIESIIYAIGVMGCERLRYLTLMIVNCKMTRRKELAKEKVWWKALEDILVRCPAMVELSVLYLYGVSTSASWGETRYGNFSEYCEREDKLFKWHGKAIRKWLARVGQRSTIWRFVKTVPWGERYAVCARAGDIERMFGPAM